MSIPSKLVTEALAWLKTRNRSVSRHIKLHNSSAGEAGATRPWLLLKPSHSVTRGGDRVARDLIERTLKDPTRAVLQRNGSWLVERDFGRQVGKHPLQRAFRIIVRPNGVVRTAFPVAAASVAALAILEQKIEETLDGMEQIHAQHTRARARNSEPFAMFVVEFVTALIPYVDLTPGTLGAEEGLYLAQGRFQALMERQYLAALQESEQRSFGPADLAEARGRFLDGIVGVAAPYA